jgi:hypothetical protein
MSTVCNILRFAACAAVSSAAFAQSSPTVLAPPKPVDVRPVANAKPLKADAFDALKGEGIYYFSGMRMVNLKVNDKPQGDRYPIVETSNDAAVTAFNGNIDVRHFVRDGERRAVGKPSFAIPQADGTVQLVYQSSSPLHVKVSLQSYDVSNLPIRDFLRTPENYTKPEAARVGNAVFPAGSVAYLVSVRFLDDVLMLPRHESFTGAANTRQLVANFSKDTPFCLSYEDRNGARPYALHFRDAAATRGRVQLYPAKTGTMFCARGSEQEAADGTWEELRVGGTRAVVLSFSANVDPLDTGVSEVEREAAHLAFIEIAKGGAPSVRPGKLYRAGARIADFQYRFNATAAAAIRASLGL